MSIFKQKEEEVEEEKPRFSKKPLVSTKETLVRKKKKEPPKPWGKKERYLVLSILVFTIVTSGVLALSAREWKLPGFPRIKLPSFSFFSSSPIVIEGDNKTQKIKLEKKKEEITSKFKDMTRNLSGVYGFYIVDLKTSYSFGLYEDEIFQAASLIKLPVMIGLYKEAEAGKLDLESKIKLKGSDKVSGAGSLYAKPEGYEVSFKDLIFLMAKQSDNTAFNIAKKYLGNEKISNVTSSLGMKDTSLEENQTTPKDIGILFESLWKGNVLSSSNKEELLQFLTDTLYEEWLKKGVPKEVRLAHKYGREIHVVNDAGVVYTTYPYVVVVLTKGVVEKEADEALPKLSSFIYETMQKD